MEAAILLFMSMKYLQNWPRVVNSASLFPNVEVEGHQSIDSDDS